MNKRFLLFFGMLMGSLALFYSTGFLLHNQEISIGIQADSSSHPTSGCALSGHFPPEIQQWCKLITANAQANNLDPNLIAALIWQESEGNPDAYSKDGAVGLMQVMPQDGIAVGFMCPNGPCFASRPSMEELFTPTFNVEYGCRFLSGLLNRSGSLREALKAYGPAGIGYSYADIVLSVYQDSQ